MQRHSKGLAHNLWKVSYLLFNIHSIFSRIIISLTRASQSLIRGGSVLIHLFMITFLPNMSRVLKTSENWRKEDGIMPIRHISGEAATFCLHISDSLSQTLFQKSEIKGHPKDREKVYRCCCCILGIEESFIYYTTVVCRYVSSMYNIKLQFFESIANWNLRRQTYNIFPDIFFNVTFQILNPCPS